MSESDIVARLVAEGKKFYAAAPAPVVFTKEPEPDAFLNNLKNQPHAFVLRCVMDRQIKAERAWMIPYVFAQTLGDFSIEALGGLDIDQVHEIMTNPQPLHRFPKKMSRNFLEAIELIVTQYGGDASAIWSDVPSSATVVYRFLQFRGVGQKIGTMAANILARQFKVRFADHYSIDISADVHVKRVFKRLELVGDDATPE